ncbi:MAG: paraquat-inducible protein A [Pirellula sp.]
MSDPNNSSPKACHCCGLVQLVPKHSDDSVSNDFVAVCSRCDTPIASSACRESMRAKVSAFSIAALALYPSAILLPIMKIERLGHHHESSVLGGIWELVTSGNIFIAAVIFLFSILFPLFKLIALVELTWLELFSHRHRAFTYRMMEWAGKWSMMDVMLIAFLVMSVKLSGLIEFQFGLAIFSFFACVSFSLLATIAFDPHALWETS